MAKNKFSKDWIHQHINDPYVKLAQQKGYRARAAFKLIEILDTEKLMRRGDRWSTWARRPAAGPRSRASAWRAGRDRGRAHHRPGHPAHGARGGVEFIQGDFREDEVLKQLEEMVGSRAVDLVISDMAPTCPG